jgi:hypothetical protein
MKLTEFKHSFTPTPQQEMAKARLHRNTADAFLKPTDMSIAALSNMAGVSMPQIEKWGQQEGWAAWFFEHDTAEKNILALKEIAINQLRDIVTLPLGDGKDGSVTPKDKLKAIEIIVEVADMLPNKRKEISFIDKDLGKMDAETVDAETVKLKAKLKEIK